jgi:hypothetical protein
MEKGGKQKLDSEFYVGMETLHACIQTQEWVYKLWRKRRRTNNISNR